MFSLEVGSSDMYFPLFCRSNYSILHAYPNTDEFAPRLKQLGLAGCGLVEMGNMGGMPSFLKNMKDTKLKGLAGCEFFVKQQEGYGTLWVLARNQEGWKDLIRAVSESQHPRNREDDRPQITLDFLAQCSKNWFVFCGGPGSVLTSGLFTSDAAFVADSPEAYRNLLRPDADRVARETLRRLQSYFGDRLWLDIHLNDPDAFSVQTFLADRLRELSQETGVPCVAASDCRYLSQEDASDLHIMQCVHYKTKMATILKAIEKGDYRNLWLFRSRRFHLRTAQEMREVHTDGELKATLDIAEQCESPAISGKILTPDFPCPNGKTPDQYFADICREGWARKINPLLKLMPSSIRARKKQEYADRIKMELEVLTGAGFSTYFLMVQDYINFARNILKTKVGPGRGSVGGSLAAYLMGITQVDPIEYELLFERFVNKGRLDPVNSSPPDIDVDFQISAREPIIKYLREKYGNDCVSQMGTFTKFKGRSSLRSVLSAHDCCSFAEMSDITDPVPDESAITDDLEEMQKMEEERSIVLWSLQNESEKLKAWCWVDVDGELHGDYAFEFAQAIRLEGRCRGMGKHASGIVVTPVPVHTIVPMTYDKNHDEWMTGYDMRDSEKAGLLKVDILGLATLDCLQMYEKLMRTGKIEGD